MIQAGTFFSSKFIKHFNLFSWRFSIAARCSSQNSRHFSGRFSHLRSFDEILPIKSTITSKYHTVTQLRYHPLPLSIRYISGINKGDDLKQDNGKTSLEQPPLGRALSTELNVNLQQTGFITYDFTKLDKVLTFHVNNLQKNGFSEERVEAAVNDTVDALNNDTLKHIRQLLMHGAIRIWSILDLKRNGKRAVSNASEEIVVQKLNTLLEEISENATNLSSQAMLNLLPVYFLTKDCGIHNLLSLNKAEELDAKNLYIAWQFLKNKQRASIIIQRLSRIIKDREVHAKSSPEEIKWVVKLLVMIEESDLFTEAMMAESMKFIREVVFDGDALSSGTLGLDIMTFITWIPDITKEIHCDMYSKVYSRFDEIVSDLSLSSEILPLSNFFGHANLSIIHYNQNNDEDFSGSNEEDKISAKSFFLKCLKQLQLRRVLHSKSSHYHDRVEAACVLSRFRQYGQIQLTEEDYKSMEDSLVENIEMSHLFAIKRMLPMITRTWPSNVKLVHTAYDQCLEAIEDSDHGAIKVTILNLFGSILCARKQHPDDSEYLKKYLDLCSQHVKLEYLRLYKEAGVLNIISLNTEAAGISTELYRDCMSYLRFKDRRQVNLGRFDFKSPFKFENRYQRQFINSLNVYLLQKETLKKYEKKWFARFIQRYGHHSDIYLVPEERMYSEIYNALSHKSKSEKILVIENYIERLSKEHIDREFDENMSSILCDNVDSFSLKTTGLYIKRFVLTGHDPHNKEDLKEVVSQKLRGQKSLDVAILHCLSVMNICPEDLLSQAMENIETVRKNYRSTHAFELHFYWLNLTAVLDSPQLGIPWLHMKRTFAPDPLLKGFHTCLCQVLGKRISFKVEYNLYTEAAFMTSKSKKILHTNNPTCTNAKKYAIIGTGAFTSFTNQAYAAEPNWYAKANERYLRKLGYNIIKIDSTDWAFLPRHHQIQYLTRILSKILKEGSYIRSIRDTLPSHMQ